MTGTLLLKTLRRFSRFLIYSNLFVSISVTCFTWETLHVFLGEKINYRYLGIVFFSTLFFYNFHRWFGLRGKPEAGLSGRHLWVKKNFGFIVLVFVFSGGILLSQAFFPGNDVFLWLLPLGVITFAYTVPFLKTRKGWLRLRDIPGAKVFIIISVCAVVTTVLPFVYHRETGLLVDPGFQLFFTSRFFFLLAITLPFDMRDMQFDRLQGVKTVPVLAGPEKTKIFCYISFLFSMFPLLGIGRIDLPVTGIAVALLGMLAVYRLRPGTGEWYYAYCLEGLMVLKWVMMLAWEAFGINTQ